MAATTGTRLDLLDVFRGAAVAGMILVTSPGDWNSAYPWLRHATWDGWTLADMVFPAFLFAVGFAIGLSFPRDLSAPGVRYRFWVRIVRRAAALILIGLALNWVTTAAIPGIPLYIGQPGLAHVRLPGVLQRIALCYVISLGVVTTFPRRLPDGRTDIDARAILVAIALLLVGYWMLLGFTPVPGYGTGRLDPEGNLASYVDRAIFTPAHMWLLGSLTWAGPVVFDPEGLLSTLPATTNTLLGILAALVWRRPQGNAVRLMAGGGIAMMIAGVLLNPVLPINKLIWTSSFALLSGGFSLVTLCLIAVALRSAAVARVVLPLRILGTNAVLAYVLSILLSKISGAPWFRFDGETVTAQAWGYAVAHSVISDQSLAATACAMGVLAAIVLILWPLHRRAIRFRL